jgi:hypothetical protein
LLVSSVSTVQASLRSTEIGVPQADSVRPNFGTVTDPTVANAQNSAAFQEGDRIVVLNTPVLRRDFLDDSGAHAVYHVVPRLIRGFVGRQVAV